MEIKNSTLLRMLENMRPWNIRAAILRKLDNGRILRLVDWVRLAAMKGA